MSGDYTRFTFDHKKNYAGVLKQQGRVSLDADWNEYIEIQDRRWRSETMDIIGPKDQGRGIVTETFPDAFKITPTDQGEFTIGNGRIYVDGIQVESHGLGPDEFEARLAECRGTKEYSYRDQHQHSNQPYYPYPLPQDLKDNRLPPIIGRTDLVYLDVWQREVTALEDPDLREKALGGPDTATRTQSIWQVRVLTGVGKHDCHDAIDRWSNLISPSAGRLTTSAIGTPSSDDPCIIPPEGGYRGLDNRLYRVEIHTPGPLGTAKFKWSRDNGSIISTVDTIPAGNQITVKRLGRDKTLRFQQGDWVEILDDYSELKGQAGHMAKVTGIDEATCTLTIDPAIPGSYNFDASDPNRHTRVRLWDQKGTVRDVNDNIIEDLDDPVSTGVITVPDDGTEVLLEKGVKISFSIAPDLASDSFRAGDYWVFAARTADGKIEELTDAPPRGIHHHYCKLAFITWADAVEATLVVDCREHWPWLDCDGCCTVTVGDGIDSRGQFTDIQKAIDSLGNRGGTVCIGRGVYVVDNPIRIDATKRNVTVVGMGSATIIALQVTEQGATSVFQISGTQNVSIERLFAAATSDEIIKIDSSYSCAVRQCTLVNLKFQDPVKATAGRAIYLTNGVTRCSIEKNAILAQQGIVQTRGHSSFFSTSELSIIDNLFLASLVSVKVEEARSIDISRNQLRGIDASRAKMKNKSASPGHPREFYFEFESEVSEMFASTSFEEKQAAGIFMNLAALVNMSENQISACVGAIFGGLFAGDFESNIFMSLMGLALLTDVKDGIRFTNNFVTAPLTAETSNKKEESSPLSAGILNMCILSSSIHVEGNQFKGQNAIVMQSLNETLAGSSIDNSLRFGPSIAEELERMKITSDGKLLIAMVLIPILRQQGAAGNVQQAVLEALDNKDPKPLPEGTGAFGIAVGHRYERNDFSANQRGIVKSELIVSADISIVDNTFQGCDLEAIYFGYSDSKLLPSIGLISEAGHVIQGNAFNIKGKGIFSEASHTRIEDNNIVCTEISIEIDAPYSCIKNNYIRGVGTDDAPDNGLILVQGSSYNLNISGNTLAGGPGHGILIQESVYEVNVDDNLIESMRGNGITTANDAIDVNNLRILQNRIQKCKGRFHENRVLSGVALFVEGGTDLLILDNVFLDNTEAGSISARYTVALHRVDGIDFRGNLVENNGTLGGIVIVYDPDVDGDRTVSIQGNTIRENGGSFALYISYAVRRVLVSNNYFGSNRAAVGLIYVRARWLEFSNNECLLSNADTYVAVTLSGLPYVLVEHNILKTDGKYGLYVGTGLDPSKAGYAIVQGNLVDTNENEPIPAFGAVYIYVTAGGGIVTSNFTRSLGVYPPARVVQDNNRLLT